MPVDLCKPGMRGAQALGLLENGGERIIAGHLVSLEFDLDLIPSSGRAKLLKGGIFQSFAVMKKLEPAIV
jgi:hypothetical protein